MREILSIDVAKEYEHLTTHVTVDKYLQGMVHENNYIDTNPGFVPPVTAHLVVRTRHLWKEVNPYYSSESSKNKPSEHETQKLEALAIRGPIFHIKQHNRNLYEADFDKCVVDGFIADSEDQCEYERYFAKVDRWDTDAEYAKLVIDCAEYLPNFVQGDLLCKLICAKPLQDGTRPFQAKIISRPDIVNKFVLFQYAAIIEEVILRMEAAQPALRAPASPERLLEQGKKVVVNFLSKSDVPTTFNPKRSRFAQFVGRRLIDYLCRSADGKKASVHNKEARKTILFSASFTTHYIYQILLALMATNPIDPLGVNLLKDFENYLDAFL
ncbi:MAG: hypothetical protein M3R00_10755, partial [Pseudomonadota bacterium]|nr:hypothetical protein [Pseudomonadota bacterium]